jgi:hypothetical protein
MIPLLIATGWDAMSLAVDPPTRQTEIIIPYTEYEWWLMRWSNNSYECQILVDHEGLPYPNDIFVQCGDSLYQEWLDTETCEPVLKGDETSSCKGLYLHQIVSEPKEKVVLVDLPLPEAWISISGCTPIPPGNLCETLPNLLIHAEEPLPNETIIQVQGTYNNIPFVCSGDTCEVPLRPTLGEGVVITFWADSSFGDSSKQYEALVRVTDSGVAEGPEKAGWIIDVMSDRLQGYETLGCGPIWNSFPPIGSLPGWLESPESPELLASNEPYMYLAGRLIAQGFVDAGDCPGGGLESNGYANTCGLENARTIVNDWQNRFDPQIVAVSAETGIPSQLLKNLFAQESQFWPGVYHNTDEFGLGHLTELGADTILLWNPSFYYQFCPLVLNAATCDLGYAQLSEGDQAILRGAVAIRASSDCPSCSAGIDLNHAILSIDLFAQTILANCQQAGQIVTNNYGEYPGSVARYEDLWRLTLVNYHAGPGCLSNAVQSLAGRALTWENIAPRLERESPGIQQYTETITKDK